MIFETQKFKTEIAQLKEEIAERTLVEERLMAVDRLVPAYLKGPGNPNPGWGYAGNGAQGNRWRTEQMSNINLRHTGWQDDNKNLEEGGNPNRFDLRRWGGWIPDM